MIDGLNLMINTIIACFQNDSYVYYRFFFFLIFYFSLKIVHYLASWIVGSEYSIFFTIFICNTSSKYSKKKKTVEIDENKYEK